MPGKSVYSGLIIQEDPEHIVFNAPRAKLEQRAGKPIGEIDLYKEQGRYSYEYTYEEWVFNGESAGVLKVRGFDEGGRLREIRFATQLGDYFFKLDVSQILVSRANGEPVEHGDAGIPEDESELLFRMIVRHALNYKFALD